MIPCSHFSCFSRAVISMSMPCFPVQLYVMQIYLLRGYLYLPNGPLFFFVICSFQGLRITSQVIYRIISPSFKDSLLCTSRQPVSTPIGVPAQGGSVETQDSLFELLLLPGGGTPCFCCLVPSRLSLVVSSRL